MTQTVVRQEFDVSKYLLDAAQSLSEAAASVEVIEDAVLVDGNVDVLEHRRGRSLRECESVIEQGLETFRDVGTALLEIRDNRLYRETGYATFAQYCRERWGFSRQRGYQLMSAAQVSNVLDTAGLEAPRNARQAAELARLNDPEEQVEVWRAVVEKFGENVTAQQVREAIRPEVLPPKRRPAELVNQSLTNEWYTPPEVIEAARAVLGAIDLDPASSPMANETVQATHFYTEADDGLIQPWSGRVWLNPPYGSLVGKFVGKLVAEYEARNVAAAILLVNSNSAEVGWFAPLWGAYPLAFTSGARVNFVPGAGQEASGATHGSCFVYFGSYPETFAEEFERLGCEIALGVPRRLRSAMLALAAD
jgi:phage N-6-adenine-methyltransferase